MHPFLTVRSTVVAFSSLEYEISTIARHFQERGARLPENAAVDQPQLVPAVTGIMGWNFVPPVAPARDAVGMLDVVVSGGLCTVTPSAGEGLQGTAAEFINF